MRSTASFERRALVVELEARHLGGDLAGRLDARPRVAEDDGEATRVHVKLGERTHDAADLHVDGNEVADVAAGDQPPQSRP